MFSFRQTCFLYMLLLGWAVVQWLTLLPLSTKGPGWNPGWYLSVWILHVIVCMCGFTPDPRVQKCASLIHWGL